MASVSKSKCKKIIIQELNIQFLLAPMSLYLFIDSCQHINILVSSHASVIKLFRHVIYSHSINNFVKGRLDTKNIYICTYISRPKHARPLPKISLNDNIFQGCIFVMSRETVKQLLVKHYLYYLYLFLIRWFSQTCKDSAGLSIILIHLVHSLEMLYMLW